jgi:hypothetical protein
MNFETQVKQLAEKAVLNMFAKADNWLQADYSNRVKIPASLMAEVWALVDVEKIKKQMAARLEKDLADRIVNHMAAELATDVKQILSVAERREALRAVCRENMERICGGTAIRSE